MQRKERPQHMGSEMAILAVLADEGRKARQSQSRKRRRTKGVGFFEDFTSTAPVITHYCKRRIFLSILPGKKLRSLKDRTEVYTSVNPVLCNLIIIFVL
jgi:hypothetical protein